MLEEGLRYVIDGAPKQAVFPPGPLTGEQAVDNAAMLAGVVDTYIASSLGRAHLERVLEELLAKRIPPPATPSTPPAEPKTSTPKASERAEIVGPRGIVDIPPEVRERMQKFSVPQLMEATGLDRTSVSRFRSGSRTRLSQATRDKIVAGLEQLESQS
jgi:hypothetical protein